MTLSRYASVKPDSKYYGHCNVVFEGRDLPIPWCAGGGWVDGGGGWLRNIRVLRASLVVNPQFDHRGKKQSLNLAHNFSFLFFLSFCRSQGETFCPVNLIDANPTPRGGLLFKWFYFKNVALKWQLKARLPSLFLSSFFLPWEETPT